MPTSKAIPPDRRGARSPAGNAEAESAELSELRAQLREATETIEAIRTGGIDSLVIGPPGQEQVYALATADRPYRLIVETMNEGTAIISPRGVILDANPRLSAMTGRSRNELAGATAADLAPDAHRSTFARLLNVAAGDSARGETELTGPHGSAFPVLFSVSRFDLDGMAVRCLILTDLTLQRRAEDQVRLLNAELEERVRQRTAELQRLNDSLESFSYTISHDLRAPLRSMSGFSEALLDEYDGVLGENGHDYVTRIQAASGRMSTLIEDVLRLSRESRVTTDLGPVDLSAEVADIADELRAADPGRHVRFAVQDGVWVSADRALIRTVVQNLMENAWKFTARRQQAVIEFSAVTGEDGLVRCQVRDNGAGFEAASAGKLFQPFQRLHSFGDFPGTGIGLASVRQIVERHGGRAWAESTMGEGASFYFTLPAAIRPPSPV
jgi:PAS domain S-box-containing protein